jgi:hypothetical protein
MKDLKVMPVATSRAVGVAGAASSTTTTTPWRLG